MTMKWIEVIAVVIAACAMLFSGFQTMILVRTIDAPYKSNLQDRQIDACVGLIEAYSAYAGSLRLLSIDTTDLLTPSFKELRQRLADELKSADETGAAAPETGGKNEIGPGALWAFAEYKSLADFGANYRGEVLAQIGKLRVYAGSETNQKLDALQAAIFDDQVEEMTSAYKMREQFKTGEFSKDALPKQTSEKPSRGAYEALEDRCRSVMLGESVGFL